jgi:hypothetical protein
MTPQVFRRFQSPLGFSARAAERAAQREGVSEDAQVGDLPGQIAPSLLNSDGIATPVRVGME